MNLCALAARLCRRLGLSEEALAAVIDWLCGEEVQDLLYSSIVKPRAIEDLLAQMWEAQHVRGR